VYGNEQSVTNRSADDGTLYHGRRSAEYFEAADGGGYLCSDPRILGSYFYLLYFHDSISTWYNIDKTKVVGYIKRDMILDRETLTRGKTHASRGLIPDHMFVTDVVVHPTSSVLQARIRDWMASNRLKLNEDKTQVIWLGTCQQLNKVTTQC